MSRPDDAAFRRLGGRGQIPATRPTCHRPRACVQGMSAKGRVAPSPGSFCATFPYDGAALGRQNATHRRTDHTPTVSR